MNLLYTILFIYILNYYKIYSFYNIKKINNLYYYNSKNIKINNQYSYSKTIKYSIIYKKYETYAFSKCIEFKNRYNIYVKNNEELFMYGRMGLYKAIINYNFNSNTSFYNYLQKYIYGELYNYVTDKYPLSIIPRYIRKNNKYNNKKYKLFPLLVQNYWYFDKIKNNNEYNEYNHNNINTIWMLIYNNLDYNSFFIFKNKYDYNFNIKSSNLHISKLLGVSEEYIRLNLIKSKNIIKNILDER